MKRVRLIWQHYTEGDAGKLSPSPQYSLCQRENWDKLFDAYAKVGASGTWTLEGKPVMCGGLVMMFPGSAEGWLVADQAIREYPYMALLAVSHALEFFISRLHLVRIQATAAKEWEQAGRFLRKLGFEREALLRKAGPFGEDMELYARVS